VKAKAMRPAREDEIRAIGAVPGYGSPVGVKDSVIIVVDDAIAYSPNLVAGANEDGYHLKNVNLERDYKATIITDIASACEGDACPNCGRPLRAVRGVEVGNIFKLGTRFSAEMGATFLDNEGNSKPVIMGSYGIGVGRLLACIAEHHRDEQGLKWPVSVAPYHVYIVSLPGGETAAESLYADLQAQGIEVLFDERDERPGVKFNDADLIGIPLRITVSKRSLEQGGVEFKRRDKDEKEIVPMHDLCAKVKTVLKALQAAIDASVAPVPFDG
jgi:prolyl-tRNA synthetase